MSDTEFPVPPELLKKKSRGCLYLALLVAGGIVALVTLLVVLLSHRWKEFVARQKVALAQLNARTGERDPLIGPATPGNGWDDYTPALERIMAERKKGKTSDEANAVGMALGDPSKVEAVQRARTLLATLAGEIDRLRSGARRGQARFASDWSKGVAAEIPSLLSSQEAGNLLVFSARERLAAGDLDGAMDDLSCGLQLGLDLANTPTLISAMLGTAILKIQIDELKSAIEDPRATPAQLERSIRLLSAVDRQYPGYGKVLETELIVTNQTFAGELSSNFLGRLMVVQASASAHRMLEVAKRGEGMDLLSATTLCDKTVKEETPFWNIIARTYLPGLMSYKREMRARRGHIRTLRAAAMVRLGRGPSDPDWPIDPFTLKPLGHKVDGNTVRVWSVWSDCVDGTIGSWTPKTSEEDLLLKVKK